MGSLCAEYNISTGAEWNGCTSAIRFYSPLICAQADHLQPPAHPQGTIVDS